MSKYKEFYEKVERESEYSGGLIAEEHPFYLTLRKIIEKYNLENSKVLEIGSGNGRFQDVVEDYTGIDISEKAARFYHKPYFIIDESDREYPFEDGNFDLIFTNAVFEHIPNIDWALKEMVRVLKKGGYIIFKPAWQCRPWAAEGYPVRPYSDFNWFGKMYKFSIIIRNNIIFRLSYTIPKRIYYLVKYWINNEDFKNKLVYKKLRPNYEKFWMSDSDACNSIEPFMAILYFRANDFEIINYPTLLKQFLIRTDELILRKI